METDSDRRGRRYEEGLIRQGLYTAPNTAESPTTVKQQAKVEICPNCGSDKRTPRYPWQHCRDCDPVFVGKRTTVA